MTGELIKQRIKDGDENAIRLAYLVYANEILIDIFEMISMDIKDATMKQGLLVRKTKHVINKYRKAALEMAKDQHRYIGDDGAAEMFGDLSDYMYELILNGMFIPEEDRIKLVSYAKQLNKKHRLT